MHEAIHERLQDCCLEEEFDRGSSEYDGRRRMSVCSEARCFVEGTERRLHYHKVVVVVRLQSVSGEVGDCFVPDLLVERIPCGVVFIVAHAELV